MDITVIGPYVVPLLALAASYGALSARLKAVEAHIDQTVTRAEFRALSHRLDEMVTELRGLRSDLISVIRER